MPYVAADRGGMGPEKDAHKKGQGWTSPPFSGSRFSACYPSTAAVEGTTLPLNSAFRYSRFSRAMNFTLTPFGHTAWHS